MKQEEQRPKQPPKKVSFGPTHIKLIPSRNKSPAGKKQINDIRREEPTEITLGRYACLNNQTDREEKEEYETQKQHQVKTKTKKKRKRIRKNKNLTIAVVNVNGIKGKIRSLESMLQTEKVTIALITETKLTGKQGINIRGYTWIGKNRNNKTGGGVGILVSNQVAQNATEDTSSEEEEKLETKWINLECRPKNIKIGVFYGPQENEKIEQVKEVYEQLERQIDQKKKESEKIKI